VSSFLPHRKSKSLPEVRAWRHMVLVDLGRPIHHLPSRASRRRRGPRRDDRPRILPLSNEAGNPRAVPTVQEEAHREPLADIDTRDRVYRVLLQSLRLSSAHLEQLHKRDFRSDAIRAQSTGRSPRRWRATERGGRRSADHASPYLLGVPGFFKRSGSKTARLGGTPGLLIPDRDAAGKILAAPFASTATMRAANYRWLARRPDDGLRPGRAGSRPILKLARTPNVRYHRGSS